MTPAKTADRPASLLDDEPLPDELQIAPPAAPVVEQTYVMVPVDAIVPNPANPRKDLGDLTGLVASIRANGILQALSIEWSSPTSPYLLLAGHRRLAAAKLAGLSEVPCLVRQTASTDADRMKIALVENLMREGLAPLDEARGYAELVKLGMSQREIAAQVGCSQGHVSKRVGLLDLPAPVQAKVGEGSLTLEAAALLARLADHPDKLAKAAQGASVSQIARDVESAEADIAFEAKRAELVAIAEGKKCAIVDEPRDAWSARKFKTLAKWNHADAELNIDVRKHEAEPCHAVMIPKHRNYYNSKPTATSVCTDPARHGPKGKSDLKVKAQAKRKPNDHEVKEAQRRLERKAAGEARAALLTKAVEAYTPRCTRSPELPLMLKAGVQRTMGYDTAQLACELLGVDPGGKGANSEAHGALNRFAGESQANLHRVALALAFAVVEVGLTSPYARFEDRGVADHYAYLATLGYELAPFERDAMAEAAKSEEADDG